MYVIIWCNYVYEELLGVRISLGFLVDWKLSCSSALSDTEIFDQERDFQTCLYPWTEQISNMLIILMSITICMWNGVNIKMLITFLRYHNLRLASHGF